jgi:hypothetical protein
VRKVPGRSCIINTPAFDCTHYRCCCLLHPRIEPHLKRGAQGCSRLSTYLSEDGRGAGFDRSCSSRRIPRDSVKDSTARGGKTARRFAIQRHTADQWLKSHGSFA